MKQVITIIIFILVNNYASGQNKLTKDEILKSWTSNNNQTNNTNIIVNSDSFLNVQLTKIVDSLQANNIDSIIIYSTALPGYISSSKCDTGIFPITSFIIWHKGDTTRIKKIQGNCSFEINKDSLIYLFNFYNNNYRKLESEFFMPVIFSGQISKDKKISYSMSWIDHEPNYSFYYKVGKHSKSFEFCESYLDNKKSLFHSYNLNLSVYHWWRQVKQEMDKID